eukprot:16437397-Heterocapsa_arctica.AAC.1
MNESSGMGQPLSQATGIGAAPFHLQRPKRGFTGFRRIGFQGWTACPEELACSSPGTGVLRQEKLNR